MASAALAFGGTVVTASPASAVGSSACGYRYYATPLKTTTAVNLRNGPSTSYDSQGVLRRGTGFNLYCVKRDFSWYYGKVVGGANSGTWGWVYWRYLTGRS
ncbi:SH3 domain-containing protein [Streptomyces himalayensis]|uniref:SH3 domain-containing protein n=1 Tax=Streptomyces himalayensis subsp. himalayensis TaxID=2756131 RepID=A0A7W0DSQ4_9ACTN|nr:SH3 domain-containing protein [Streptomyces himalayensis]MBA2950536.1 SH3 domain-containing protein [Streptomyces himalayensis subsp. himalayensis]